MRDTSVVKAILAASAALGLLSTQSLGDSFPSAPLYPSFASPRATLPLLSGTYVFTGQTICQPQLTVTYGKSGVTFVSLASNTTGLQEGTMKYVQGTTPGSGTVTLDATDAYGSPVLVVNSGTAGGSGTPMAQKTNKGSLAFTQTTTTFTIMDGNTPGGSTFNVYTGKITNGIIQFAAFGGLDDQGCAEQGTITLK
jgi:hypothetical protein